MRVLVVTPWFPSAAHPVSGLFNQRDAQLIARDHDVRVLHLIRPDWYEAEDARAVVAGSGGAAGIAVARVPFSASDPRTWARAAAAIRTGLRGSGQGGSGARGSASGGAGQGGSGGRGSASGGSGQIGPEQRPADLLHTMAFPALLPFAARPVRVPWVHTEHFSTLVTPVSRPVAAALSVLGRLFRRPDEVVAVSAALAAVIDRYRGRKRPASVIGNAVMLPVGPVPDEHDFGGRLRLIGVGGIVARKGPVEAVDTLVELVRRGVDAELVWAGDGELREQMLERARLGGVVDRLALLGPVAPERLSRELLESDVFLLPVETETFGVAIAEALVHGLPVVTSGTGGHEEFLDRRSSRRVDERSGAVLADAVQALIADPELPSRRAIADAAASRFSEDARAEAYRRVYARATQR
ncbi:MAG: glycosyltransferase family 4 protein [Leucobacter sp.]